MTKKYLYPAILFYCWSWVYRGCHMWLWSSSSSSMTSRKSFSENKENNRQETPSINHVFHWIRRNRSRFENVTTFQFGERVDCIQMSFQWMWQWVLICSNSSGPPFNVTFEYFHPETLSIDSSRTPPFALRREYVLRFMSNTEYVK